MPNIHFFDALGKNLVVTIGKAELADGPKSPYVMIVPEIVDIMVEVANTVPSVYPVVTYKNIQISIRDSEYIKSIGEESQQTIPPLTNGQSTTIYLKAKVAKLEEHLINSSFGVEDIYEAMPDWVEINVDGDVEFENQFKVKKAQSFPVALNVVNE